MRKLILSVLFLLATYTAQAQLNYSITGTVRGEKDGRLPGATVFLDGTEKKTATNENGEFRLDNLSPGTYELTVHYLGFNTLKQNVIILDKSIALKLALEHSEEELQEVVISGSESNNKFLGLFLRNFLGDTENGRSCKVSNPEILKFSEKTLFVMAKTNGFLEIVNENLGYKIKYLLRDFRMNRVTSVTSYTGECIFEEMKGTEAEEQKWAEQRGRAYLGSFLHFMRSVYSNTADTEGFSCRFLVDQNMLTQRLSDKVEVEHLSKMDKKQLLMFRFLLPLYVQYDPLKNHAASGEDSATKSFKEGKGSLLFPFLENALIDRKGALVDYRSFLIKLNWGTKRLGDQLPYEYLP
ncbi:hypothetical protein ACVWYN_001925 [Pedobacter sp. UYP24]